MKKTIVSITFLIAATLVLTWGCSPVSPPPPEQTHVGTVSRMIGSGVAELGGRRVFKGDRIFSGERITTGPGIKLEIELTGGGFMLIDENTDPDIFGWFESGVCKLLIIIDFGKILMDTTCMSRVNTGTDAVAETMGTRFHMWVTNRFTTLSVLSGTMTFKGASGGPVVLTPDRTSTAMPGGAASKPIRVPTGGSAEWAAPFFKSTGDFSPQPGTEVSVPKLTGMPFQQAREYILERRLKPGKVVKVPTNRKEYSGRVAKQHPIPGVVVEPGHPVDLHIYMHRTGRAVVPDLTGRRAREAEKMLSGNKLRTGKTVRIPTSNPRMHGRITGQHPAPGTRVDPGTAVNFEVMVLEEQEKSIAVPKLLGMPFKDAVKKAESLGLKPGRITETATMERKASGRVARQSPPPGTRVPTGTAVHMEIFIYRGKNPGSLMPPVDLKVR